MIKVEGINVEYDTLHSTTPYYTMYIWEVLSTDNNIMQWLDSSISLCDVITVSKSFVLPTTIQRPNESYL